MTTRDWLDPTWRASAESWAAARLAEHDLMVDGPIEQPYVAPWATVLRVPTSRGSFWFKASAAGTAYEHRMFAVLSEEVPDHVLTPLATDVERAWSLLPDAGTRLRDRLETHPDERFARWEDIVRDHAALQCSLMSSVDRMLALGVPDMRADALPGRAAALVESMDLDASLRDRARRWLPRFADACDQLARSPVQATVQQDDLHDGNVLVDGPTYRLVDWGDACVGHPFGVFMVLRESLARRGAVDPHGPELSRVADAFLETFTDRAPLAELRTELRVAEYAQGVARLCVWQRALQTATRDEGAEWSSQLPGSLADLVAATPLSSGHGEA